MAFDPTSLVILRHHLHAIAEVSGQEENTASFIAARLADCHPLELLTGLGGHGVLGVFEGRSPGATVLLRAELDALPMAETLDIDHASFTPGVAHKCGHDGHMAMLLGVAQALAEHPHDQGRVLLLFQSAEETGTGAAAVLADPRFSRFTLDWVFALHNLPGYPVGNVLVAEGTFCAAICGLDIILKGKTSHAAYPEQGRACDRAMAQLVLDLINLPDGLSPEDHPALVTVTHSRLGRPSFGISPGQAQIMATLRADRDEVLAGLQDTAAARVAMVCQESGLDHTLNWTEEFPALVNDPVAVSLARTTALNLGLDVNEPVESPFRWSEDFGRLAGLGHGAMLGIGCGITQPGLHAEDYDFNDALLPVGRNLLGKLAQSACVTWPVSLETNKE